ncbi:class I SAM-dependent methyltransferase [Roseivivax sediminis]|uniref:Methyltransferase domain-containing protein n=1 Tax=Roseivivax sediminis TaxID=936889 RepID=A0A1I1V462_9RHOB|nr:methyltransferase domain-containing protein [Roseivivax sediminis]SFD77827.1 Methyltransferase domain-containing protein [Roseivivax sediminis]
MTAPNAAQADAWGGDMGKRWVRRDADLDRQMEEVSDAVLSRAGLQPGERVLDIGCGSGALSRRAAEAVGSGGRVTGLDLSDLLLALARERAPANMEVLHGDGQVFDFGGARYDAAISRFGVMFFDDPVAAFANIGGALAPGGRLAMACWASAEANPWFRDPKAAAEARLGRTPPADPDAPGPLAFRDADRVFGILSAAGFSEREVETIDLMLHQPDGWPAMERMLPEIGPIPGVMREYDGTQDDLRAILGSLRETWARYLGPEGLRMPARVHIYRAVAQA